ncbi:MAG TPA: hypothetical protein VN827_00335 [Chthoniobacterales bacterium]|jgi:hypothetical protein|nr:hypothetical protein [Chthoniobacterales bacterium]
MNLAYHSARLEGKIARAFYRAALPMIVRHRRHIARELPLDVFAYSGENTLPEQVASIRSFLAHAGRPKQFTVVSDGSYTAASIELLEKIDICVRVQKTRPVLPPELPDATRCYLTEHPTGKQLALLMSLPTNGPTLYTDSDVLFFPGAHELADLARKSSVSAFYQADYHFSGDERLVLDPAEKQSPTNTGFILLFRKLDWSRALERLRMLSGPPNFFTNQTVTHLCMHANGAVALDPGKFVLQLDDQFIYRDRYASASIAIRHYVNPVRHKFWTALAHQIFQ